MSRVRTIEGSEPREASGVTTRLILAYVESRGGVSAVREVLARAGLEGRADELLDEDSWFPDMVRVRLLEAAAAVLGDPHAPRRIGESALDLNVASGLKVALRALGSPRLLYKNVGRANAKFNRVHEMSLLEVDGTRARIQNRPREGTPYHSVDCDYNIGLLSQAPPLFGEPPARISHTECIGRGAPACVFEIEWTDRRRLTRRLLALGAAGTVAIAATAAAVPVATLPAVEMAIAAVVLAVALAMTLATRRQNRLLAREAQQEREVAARVMESLGDLVSALRLEEVLEKITENAQAAVGGTQFALLLGGREGMRCQSSSELPADVTATLERWAAEEPALAEGTVFLDAFDEHGPLAPLRDHPTMPLGSLCAAPLVYRGHALGALVALATGDQGFLPRDVILLESYAQQAAIALTNARLYEAQQALASRDPLTGLLNHREFHETVARELERCRRYGGALTVVLLDLDEFKVVNDQSGHAEGDRVLRAAARELKIACRAADRAFRVGGDELALILPETGREDARSVAKRARARLSGVDPRTNVSFGIASWPDSGPSKDALLADADADLYAMKRSKRTRVALADGSANGNGARHERQLEAAGRLAAKLAPLLEIEDVAQSAVEHLQETLAYPAAMIMRLHPGDVLRPLAAAGPLAERVADPGAWAQRVDQGVIGRAARRGEPVLVADTSRDPGFLPSGEVVEARSELAAPIRVGGEIWGVLNLEHTEVGAFGVHDVVFADMVASEVGAAIHRVKLFGELERTFMSTIGVLSDALEAKDAYTAEHAHNVAELAERVAARLGLTGEELRTVRYAALLHDIGKIGIGGEILRKPAPLDPDEFEEMKRHPAIGAQMLEQIPFFDGVHPIVRCSHERWDGNGYPAGLCGDEIPLGARIVNACDALDAMTSDRPYRSALPVDVALTEIRDEAGRQFDPGVVEALVAIVEGRRVERRTAIA